MPTHLVHHALDCFEADEEFRGDLGTERWLEVDDLKMESTSYLMDAENEKAVDGMEREMGELKEELNRAKKLLLE